MIRIHNTLSGAKEELRPIIPGQVGIYVCGDTVYDLCHVGHARSKIAFDIARRYLTYRGFKVNFVRNITDIDDKIIKRAAERNQSIGEFTAYYIAEMHRDYDALGILRPDHEPRATDYVAGMVELTRRLIEKEHAYVAEDGDVMYSVASFGPYGQLSGKHLNELRSGARVEVDTAKRDPLDFVLWKRAKPGEPSWPSPWGAGRPGWHIECSVMAEHFLGTHFDIHGGGVDLQFPHHENEIAQSRAASGDTFAHLWMHNGFLNIDNEKMSKSLGNFFTIRDALKVVRNGEVIRYFVISSHYRGPVNYSLEQLEQADAALSRIYNALRGLKLPDVPVLSAHTQAFEAAMDDDFNTPEALAVLQALTREINTARATGKQQEAEAFGSELRTLATVLGIGQVETEEWFRRTRGTAATTAAELAHDTAGGASNAEIDALIANRIEARKRKDFRESDRIRDELVQAGVVLEDKPGGTTAWRRK